MRMIEEMEEYILISLGKSPVSYLVNREWVTSCGVST
jgi:hypothetical protein